jgi:hypothetical protein
MTAAFFTPRRLNKERVLGSSGWLPFLMKGRHHIGVMPDVVSIDSRAERRHFRIGLHPSSYRRSTLKILQLAIVAVFFGCLHSFADGKASSAGGVILQGTFWRITAAPDDASAKSGAEKFNDTISFADGKFSSAALARKGFKPAKYQGDFEEREAEFDLEQESQTEGIAIWIGELRGEKITGRLQWKKKDGTNLFFNFTGSKAAN